MSLSISNDDETNKYNASDNPQLLNGSKNSSTDDQLQQEGLNNNNQDIELIKQTKTRPENDQLDLFIEETKSMDDSSMRNETSDVIVLTTAVSLRDLLSYQDVMNAIEREFHLHTGQEREIIMKLWLKGQTMVSILQRFRHLFQDLYIDDKDFVVGIKQIRELINYTERDLQYFRDQTLLLENQNRFLENEFQRQLDKIVHEKNEQITRLTQLVDQTCSPSHHDPPVNSSSDELLKKFMQQNVELQHEIERLRAKLEYTFTFVNEKFANSTAPLSLLQTSFEQIRQAEIQIKELKFQNHSLQEENDLLKYVIEKSQQTSTINQKELLRTMEKCSLEKELERVRRELEITDKRTVELEQRFEKADETAKFHLEQFKLKCDVLRQHLAVCTERLDDLTKQKQHEESSNEKQILQLERELSQARERTNAMKTELIHTRKQLHEKEKREMSSSSELENERRHVHQLEIELKSLRTKYDDVCERVNAATHQLERVKIVLEETSHRCEQLEKEKLRKKLTEINVQSAHLSQNVTNITTKYRDKLHTIKSRLEQTERERYEAQTRCEQYLNEIELLKEDLLHKKELMLEKDKIIQNRDIQFGEYRKSNEFNEKIRLLEEELERLRQNQLIERRTDIESSTIDIEEFRLKIDEVEKRFNDEKLLRESLQVQIKILEEENIDLREIMNQMRRRAQDRRNHDRDRNDEIQQLLARVEYNARQYMTNFNLSTLTSSSSTLVKIVPLSSSTKLC